MDVRKDRQQIRFADVEVNFERSEVFRNGAPVAVAAKELQLLRYLVENCDRAVTRDELLQKVWEYHPSVTSRTIDVHVAWLRQKLEPNPHLPRYFQTVRGIGYRFTP